MKNNWEHCSSSGSDPLLRLNDGGHLKCFVHIFCYVSLASLLDLLGMAPEDVEYIMETFPIVKRKEIMAHGTYRTKERILEVYDGREGN